MRLRPAIFAPVALAAILGVAGCGGDDDGAQVVTPAPNATSATAPATDPAATSAKPNQKYSSDDSLSQQIGKNPELRTLSTAINAAGLASTIDGNRYTIFAPNNDAFTKIGSQLTTLLQPESKKQLTNTLTFHVLRGRITANKLRDGQLLTTLQGTRLRVQIKNGTVTLGNRIGTATVLVPDAKAKNGVIHVIDTVLTPKK